MAPKNDDQEDRVWIGFWVHIIIGIACIVTGILFFIANPAQPYVATLNLGEGASQIASLSPGALLCLIGFWIISRARHWRPGKKP